MKWHVASHRTRFGMIVAVSAFLGLATGLAEQGWDKALIVAFLTCLGLHALDRAGRALRDPQVSLAESGLLIMIASAGWYVFLLVFPSMMIGRPPHWTPAWYFWALPIVLLVYSTLYALRRRRGASIEY